MATTQKNGDSEPGAGDSPLAPTEDLTFTVSIPIQVQEAPAHEAALAIDDVAVTPDQVGVSGTTTTTISLGADAPLTIPEVPDEAIAAIPALPDSGDVYSRRTRLRGEATTSPEPASMLTAERLVVIGRTGLHEPPEGFLQKLLYEATFHLVQVEDSYAVRARKALDARIGRHLDGGARFIPVLTRKGGVGKTTVATLLGMAMASVREDRVIAIDANPDRGTLAERVEKTTRATVRDVVSRSLSIRAFSEFQTLISRDETRLHVLASDTDPMVSAAFDDYDYNVVAGIAEKFYSIVITDCGTGIVLPVMRATLERADSIVVVSGGSVDEARLASETLTWLESNGYADLVANSILALNTGTQGTNLVKIDEIEAHFKSRVRDIVRIPYDPSLATGSTIRFTQLKPFTRDAARDLAALVVDGLAERPSD